MKTGRPLLPEPPATPTHQDTGVRGHWPCLPCLLGICSSRCMNKGRASVTLHQRKGKSGKDLSLRLPASRLLGSPTGDFEGALKHPGLSLAPGGEGWQSKILRPLAKSHGSAHWHTQHLHFLRFYTEISDLPSSHFTDEISEAQRDLAVVTSVLILQSLESVASASDHRHYLLLHQGTPRCTHKSPTSHSSVCRCTGSTVSLRGPQGSLVCFWHVCRHRAAMQHGPEADAAGLCPYSKCTFKYCNGVFA